MSTTDRGGRRRGRRITATEDVDLTDLAEQLLHSGTHSIAPLVGAGDRANGGNTAATLVAGIDPIRHDALLTIARVRLHSVRQ